MRYERGDDAAVLTWEKGASVVVSSDAFVEGVHFRRAWLRWEAVGYRADQETDDVNELYVVPIEGGATRAGDIANDTVRQALNK